MLQVYADEHVAIDQSHANGSKTTNMEQSLMQYELCTAASAGNMEKTRQLLEDGADANTADYDQRTALHIACSDGHLGVVQLLVDAGALILVHDRWGSTPFDDASRRKHSDIVGYLSDALTLLGLRTPASELKSFSPCSPRESLFS